MHFELLTFLSATNSFSTVVRLLISSSYLLKKEKKGAEANSIIRHTDINHQVSIMTSTCSKAAIKHYKISVWRPNIRPFQDQKLLHEQPH